MFMVGIMVFILGVGIVFGPLIGVVVLYSRVRKLETRVKRLETPDGVARTSTASQPVVQKPLMQEASLETTSPLIDEPKSEKRVTIQKVSRLRKKRETPKWLKNLFTVESIISKLGILLLLIGVGFIFKMAYDQGYVTEELAVFLGVLLGAIQVFLAGRVRKKQRIILSQVLYGGAIATFYISVFAAYQSYGLIAGIIAFILMCLVTLYGFSLALLLDSLPMSVIAVLGGLLTPFVLQISELQLLGTGVYIVILTGLAMALYVVKGWRILQLSSVVGVYLVTTFFITLVSENHQERLQLALLMLTVMLIFLGVEYGLAYWKLSTGKSTAVTYLLLLSLPIITGLQVWSLLDLTDHEWAVIWAVTALGYLLLSTVLYHRDVNLIVENITYSMIGVFSLLAIVLWLGGDIRILGIAVLAFSYSLLGYRLKIEYVRWIGRVVALIALVTAVVDFVDTLQGDGITTLIVRLVVGAVLLLCAVTDRMSFRKMLITSTISLYLLPVTTLQVFEWTDGWEPLAITVLFHGLMMVLLHFLIKKWRVIYTWALLLLCAAPVLLKVLDSIFVVAAEGPNSFTAGAFAIYAVILYGITYINREDKHHILKLMAYGILYLLLLFDLPSLLNTSAVGLLGSGLLLVVKDRLEKDKEDRLFVNVRRGIRILWLLGFFVYLIAGEFDGTFDAVDLVLEGLAIALSAWHLRYLSGSLPLTLKFGTHGILYMLFISGNIGSLVYGTGLVTLLWAAYAIGMLTYAVGKSHKGLVTLSLGYTVFVAAKFIFVDLAEVTILWKIIVSLLFGSALLVLSYLLQPILAHKEETTE